MISIQIVPDDLPSSTAAEKSFNVQRTNDEWLNVFKAVRLGGNNAYDSTDALLCSHLAANTQYHFMANPVVLGSDRSLFEDLKGKIDLSLVTTRP
jgi:hypothetical protein